MATKVARWQKGKLTMPKEDMLGGSLAEVAGPLKDLAEKLGGGEGRQWLEAFKRFLRKEEPWPKLLIWRIIKLGSGLKTADDFRKLLEKTRCQGSDWASNMMNRPAFAESLAGVDPEEEYDLVRLTTTQLTGKNGGTTAEVFAGAERLGLKKCPAWMGPKLRSEYLNQPNGEWILIGMEPIADSDGGPLVFSVGRNGSELWLSGRWSGPDDVWDPGRRWVFRLPRK